MKAATVVHVSAVDAGRISIHAAREGGDLHRIPGQHRGCHLISIHAAREGGDPCQRIGCRAGVISIHAAREGGDPVMIALYNDVFEFQSTPPVKAATFANCAIISS